MVSGGLLHARSRMQGVAKGYNGLMRRTEHTAARLPSAAATCSAVRWSKLDALTATPALRNRRIRGTLQSYTQVQSACAASMPGMSSLGCKQQQRIPQGMLRHCLEYLYLLPITQT